MTQAPGGWYPDPAPQTVPGRLRYWDGARWTEHVHDRYHPAPAPRRQDTTTPDGQALAHWWERLAAQVIDGVIIDLVLLAIWVPVLSSQWHKLRDWFDAAERIDPDTEALPPLPDFINPADLLFWELIGVSMVIWVVYVVGFWRWKQATPGKLMMGLRIRRRDAPGDFPWRLIWIRYGITFAFGLVGVVAVLDGLWPLWDEQRQALHDKVAGTNVVTVRPARPPVVEPLEATTAAGAAPRW